MKQVGNGYCDYYYLTETGEIYDKQRKLYIKPGEKHIFRLRKKDNSIHKIALKPLYMLVFNKVFCVDNIENLKNEHWKVIDHTNNTYYVSNLGRIKSYAGYEAKVLKPTITKTGYERLDIVIEGHRASKFVHILVANAYLPKPDAIDLQIHHKDCNKRNNKADNLQFVSKQEHLKLHTGRK